MHKLITSTRNPWQDRDTHYSGSISSQNDDFFVTDFGEDGALTFLMKDKKAVKTVIATLRQLTLSLQLMLEESKDTESEQELPSVEIAFPSDKKFGI